MASEEKILIKGKSMLNNMMFVLVIIPLKILKKKEICFKNWFEM